MKILTRIWGAISAPFTSLAVLIDESRRQNLDGSWDSYWAKKNKKDGKNNAQNSL